MIWWIVLAGFPALTVSLIVFNAPSSQLEKLGSDFWITLLYGLAPSVVCMLGVFLWATPAISSEIEAGSWTYLAVRPNGSSSVLLGKYLCAITWTASAALVGLTAAVQIASPEDPSRVWTTLAPLILLSCPAFGAIYSLIAVLFPKRAMVAAVAYTLIVEMLLGLVPAMVNELTVQFRLRCLMWHWSGWSEDMTGRGEGARILFSDQPPIVHLLVLAGFTISLLIAALFVLRQRELCTAGDDAP
jgi:ABC-type transport system involved in multi-copper enzyme maturation permease subunit